MNVGTVCSTSGLAKHSKDMGIIEIDQDDEKPQKKKRSRSSEKHNGEYPLVLTLGPARRSYTMRTPSEAVRVEGLRYLSVGSRSYFFNLSRALAAKLSVGLRIPPQGHRGALAAIVVRLSGVPLLTALQKQ